MSSDKHSVNDHLSSIESEYLCLVCGSPLYVAAALLGGEYCLTEGCTNCLPGGMSVVDTDEAANPTLVRQLTNRKQALHDEMAGWDQQELARALAHARKDIFRGAVENGYMLGRALLHIGELILVYKSVTFDEVSTGGRTIGTLMKMIDTIAEIENFLDNCDTGRYVMVRSTVASHENNGFIPLHLKYSRAHNVDVQTSGMTHNLPNGPADEMFTFEDIDFQDFDLESGKGEEDIVRRLERFLPTSLQLDQMLRHNQRSAKQYDYESHPFAASVIAGWWVGCTDPDSVYTEYDKDLAGTLDTHFQEAGESEYSGQDFIDKYIDSAEIVPIGIRSPNGVLIDRWTLLFMLIYMYGQPVPKKYQANAGYSSSLNMFKAKKGEQFDPWIKKQLESLGLMVPVVNETYSADGITFEYDLVAVEEPGRKILIAEDKYRDVPPSSITGVNFVAQEVESSSGAIAVAIRHQKRISFFNEHFELFEDALNLEADISEYEIEQLVVTKSTPVISRFDDVRFVEVMSFLEQFR